MKHIEAAMKKLESRHVEHIKVYGEGNADRLTGRHETGSIDSFSWGVANRGASIRVPRQCAREGKGYFEDRRPASNADPYQITGIIVETVSCLPDAETPYVWGIATEKIADCNVALRLAPRGKVNSCTRRRIGDWTQYASMSLGTNTSLDLERIRQETRGGVIPDVTKQHLSGYLTYLLRFSLAIGCSICPVRC